MIRAFATGALALLICGLAAAPAAPATGTARSQDIETSIRAAGMGGATTGVTWGEPGPWGNPASLAGTQGLAWITGSTQLVPELANDVTFQSNRFLAGGAGLGFTFMGQPVTGMGHTRLDYGVSDPTSSFGSYEEIEGWGVGVSPVQLLDAWRTRRDAGAIAWSQRADVSLGYQRKETEVALAPAAIARADNTDWGVQASFAILPGDQEGHEVRVEVGAGYAELNTDEESEFDFGDPGGPQPSTLMRRTGVSLHAMLPFSSGAGEDDAPWGWWFATVPRAVELGLAYDHETIRAGGSGPEDAVGHLGFEASLMGILAARMGVVEDPYRGISGMSFGFGVRLPIGPWASFGYDWASVPQPQGSDGLSRHGFAAWLHPLAFWGGARE